MRGSFTFDRSQRRGRQRLLLATALIIVALLVDTLSGGVLRQGARSFAAGVWNVSSGVRSAVFGSGYFVSHASLAAENAALRDEVAHYQEDAAAYTHLKQENEELRALVGLTQSVRGITAPVVSSVFSSPYGTFLVGAGKDSTVAGASVLTSDGFVIGVVREVGEHISTASEIFAPGVQTDVIIGHSAAQAEGRGGGNARATLPREAAVEVGDSVTASAYGARPVGVVGSIESSPSDAEKTVFIRVPVNLSSLRFVYLSDAI